jgi:cell division protease FtsH
MDESDRRVTAFHEAGHAVVAMSLPEVEPLHKVSIISQGMALGMTMSLPEKDVYHVHRKKLLSQICLAMGGRAAEEAFCEDISTGASADIEQATELARSMVCRWGMSDVMGPISYHEGEDTVFLGREITRTRTHSEAMAVKIDQEVRDILLQAHGRAKSIIEEKREAVERLVQALLKYEVLYRRDVERIMAGEAILDRPASASEEPPQAGGDDKAPGQAENR